MSSNGRNASHGIDSERQVRTGFLFLSFDTLSCSSQKPFWPIENSLLSQIIITQTEPLSKAASIFRGAHKNSICIDAEHGFIRRFVVTPANIHDSQMLPMLLDPENHDDYVWTDSAYSGERFKDLLSLAGFKIGSMRPAQEITLLVQLQQQSSIPLGLKLELE